MTWNFVASQRESELRSADPQQAADLGVAVWIIQDYPRPEPAEGESGEGEDGGEPAEASGSYQVTVYELDLEDDDAGNRTNDRIVDLTFDITGDQIRLQDPPRQRGEHPTLALHFRMESDPRDAPVPDERQVIIKVPRGDDPDYNLEMGLRPQGEEGHPENQVMVRVGTLPPFERPDRESFENEWDMDSRPNDPPASALRGKTMGEIPDDGFPGEPAQTCWGWPIFWWAPRPASAGARRRRVTMRPLMPYVQLTGDVKMKITSYRMGRPARRYWGLMGKGERSHHLLLQAIRVLRQEYLAEDEPQYFKALAAEAATVLSEGDPSAINTYDNVVMTLGMGYAHGRLTNVLNLLKDTPVGNMLGEAFEFHDFCQADLTYEDEHAILATPLSRRGRQDDPEETQQKRLLARFDLPGYSRFVRLAEHPTYGLQIALANVREFVEYDCLLNSDDAAWANRKAREWLTAHDAGNLNTLPSGLRAFRVIVGIAAYLRHGTHAWMRDPIGDVRHALRCFDHPSKQLAVLFQRYASRAGMVRRLLVDPPPLFGKRIGHFEDALEEDSLPHRMNWRKFREVVPCLVPPANENDPHPTWLTGESFQSVPRADLPSGHVSMTLGSRRFDFGAPAQARASGSQGD